jgi:hypothetical protein
MNTTMRRASRRDRNHNQIAQAARQMGGDVVDLTDSENAGFDMLVILGGRLHVVEVKDGSKPPSARRLTDNEERRRAMLAAHGVQYHIVTTIDDLLKLREMAIKTLD